MLINELSQKTRLTKKAIRFYENKGLIEVKRLKNGYRDYDENNLKRLKEIKLLRLIGLSVSDICLYYNKIALLDDLFDKRKKEVKTECGKYSLQYENLCSLIDSFNLGHFDLQADFDETEPLCENELNCKCSIGIDIGTTSISATVFGLENNNQMDCFSILYNTDIESINPYFSLQDVEIIFQTVKQLTDYLIKRYKNAVSIGITGQMHGILYIDAKGNCVSPFVNWQDKRGDLPYKDSTYSKVIGIPTGYGICTHFYNEMNGLVPENAAKICSICDYIAMKLAGITKPLVHISLAHSFGAFDIEKSTFDIKKLKDLVNIDFLPETTCENKILGQYKGVPVSVAIGDNQASFIACAVDDETLLVNFGTGSQICAVCQQTKYVGNCELRPLIDGKKILCGAALSGGKSYALLERFVRSLVGMEYSQYARINDLAKTAYDKKIKPLNVETLFYGKRSNSTIRGSITDIDSTNFTPEAFALGFDYGMAKELYDFYVEMPVKVNKIVASGNGIRKNETLKNVVGDMFGLPLYLSNIKEEAATGAMLFGALSAKIIDDITHFVKRGNLL